MSTYDSNLVLDRDKVRFLIGDTDNDFPMLEDGEISYLLTEEGNNVLMAASRCCLAIASEFARDVNYRFSTMWQDSTDAYNHYIQLSDMLRKEGTTQTELSVSFLMSNEMQRRVDNDKVEIFFYGMHDNPETSQVPD